MVRCVYTFAVRCVASRACVHDGILLLPTVKARRHRRFFTNPFFGHPPLPNSAAPRLYPSPPPPPLAKCSCGPRRAYRSCTWREGEGEGRGPLIRGHRMLLAPLCPLSFFLSAGSSCRCCANLCGVTVKVRHTYIYIYIPLRCCGKGAIYIYICIYMYAFAVLR